MVLRIGYEPRIAGDAVGTTPIFNWLLWGYGVPALSFWIGSIFLRRRGDDAPLRTVEAAAILFTVLLVFMEIRHAVYGGDIYHADAVARRDSRLQVCAALAMAIGLERLRLRTDSIVHDISAVLLTAVCRRSSACSGCCSWKIPSSRTSSIGGSFINLLLLAYALPAVLMLLLSYAVAGRRGAAYANTIAAGALIFALTYVTLEIRRLYHGPVLNVGAISGAEQYTYSIAWLAFGVRAARHRHPRQFAARAACLGGRDRADDRQGVPDRHVDADGRLPRAVVHLPRPGAGRDRLAVPDASCSAGGTPAAPAAPAAT